MAKIKQLKKSVKKLAKSGVSSKAVIIGGVVALGITVAVGAYAGNPGAQNSLRIEAKQLVVEKKKKGKKWKQVTVERPFKSTKANPVKFQMNCAGHPGTQRKITGGALRGNGVKQIKLPFRGKTQRFTCAMSLTPPRGYKVQRGPQSVTVQKGGLKVASYILVPAPVEETGVPGPAPGKGNIQVNMPQYDPNSGVNLGTAFRSKDGMVKCEQSSSGEFTFPVSGPLSGSSFEVPLPAGNDNWYFGYNPTPTVTFIDCGPGEYDVLVRSAYDNSPETIRDQLQSVTVVPNQTVQMNFQFFPRL